MSRQKLIFIGAILLLVCALAAGYFALPKRYLVASSLIRTQVFWNNQEGFIFLDTTTSGRTDNFVLERVRRTSHSYLAFLLGGLGFMEPNVVAYHLTGSGEVKQVPLPPKATTYGEWGLQDGKLQLTPAAIGNEGQAGLRWDGEKFVPLSSDKDALSKGKSALAADDDDDDGGANYPGMLSPEERKALKAGGWHFKVLNGYRVKAAESVLSIAIGESSYELSISSAPRPRSETEVFDAMVERTKSVEISCNSNPAVHEVLWSNRGWEEISKSEYEEHTHRYQRLQSSPLIFLAWLAIAAVVLLAKLSGWGFLFSRWFGVKKRVLNNMATVYSFPPATPAQFPQLDTAELERYTHEFENSGYTKLLDFSLVPNVARPFTNFCRVFANTRNHSFAEVSQIFYAHRSPMPLKCSIQSSLDDDWMLAFSDRKPQAASSLIRRKKAVGVSMPEASTYELLQGFLQMRDQMCQDLGISYSKDDSLEAYFAKVQRTATDMRAAVKERNFLTGVSEVYYRKLALLKTKKEYVWLGDYPKEAESRRRGFSMAARPL